MAMDLDFICPFYMCRAHFVPQKMELLLPIFLKTTAGFELPPMAPANSFLANRRERSTFASFVDRLFDSLASLAGGLLNSTDKLVLHPFLMGAIRKQPYHSPPQRIRRSRAQKSKNDRPALLRCVLCTKHS